MRNCYTKDCPSSKKAIIEESSKEGKLYFVQCLGCSISGPECSSIDEAIKLWDNTNPFHRIRKHLLRYPDNTPVRIEIQACNGYAVTVTLEQFMKLL